jgi:uncharacterized protein (DUF1501 family)
MPMAGQVTRSARCTGPASRRVFLQAGALALGGLSLPDLLRARAASGNAASPTSVILLYLSGGASQLETYDLKPEAPIEYRSIFRPISTNVPGIEICEHFPRQARLADKFALVRSLSHDVNIHSDGGIVVLTGKRPEVLDPSSQSRSNHPDFGHVTSKFRGLGADATPPYIAIPQALYMTRPAYLGARHAALVVTDPTHENFRPPLVPIAGRDVKTLENRKNLLAQIDRFRRDHDPAGNLHATDEFREQAFGLLTSTKVAAAFDLAREPDALRERYGRHLWGQSCLLARRLAEAGTAVISLTINTPKVGPEFTNWDDHILNAMRPGHFGGYMTTRLPYLDEALATLIEDIYDRGLDRQVLVVVATEFGRTPKLSQNANGTGRDHWPQAYSALLSGGGLRMGQVIGATNSKAEFPTERPYTPQDLLATIYRHLGIDCAKTLPDFFGRPIRILDEGRPIRELG